MNRVICNATILRALDDLSLTIRDKMKAEGFNASSLANKADVSRKMIYPLLHEPYTAPNFNNLIAILDALGLDEITIKWR